MALTLLSNIERPHDPHPYNALHIPDGSLSAVENSTAGPSRTRSDAYPQPSFMRSRWFLERGPAKMSKSGLQFKVAHPSQVVAYGGFTVGRYTNYRFSVKISTRSPHPVLLDITIGFAPLSMILEDDTLQKTLNTWPRTHTFNLIRTVSAQNKTILECNFNRSDAKLYLLDDGLSIDSQTLKDGLSGHKSKAGSAEDFMCPIVAVAAPRWEASSNLYTVRFTSSFNHPYPLFPGRITNLRPLPVMELIDKPIGFRRIFPSEGQWKYMTSGLQVEHRFSGNGLNLSCSYFELDMRKAYDVPPLLIGFMKSKEDQYCLYYNDGRVYTDEAPVFCSRKGPCLIAGDILGCGFDFNADAVFYTRNGLLVGVFHRHKQRTLRRPQLPWKPIVGFANKQAKISTNFGHRPFLYDLRHHPEFMNIYSSTQSPRWPTFARPMTFPPEILSIILKFLSRQLVELQPGDQYLQTARCIHACRLSCKAWAAMLRAAALWQVQLVSAPTLSAFMRMTRGSQNSLDLVRIAQVIEGDPVAGETEWSYQCVALSRLAFVNVLYLDFHQAGPRRSWSVRQRLPPQFSLSPWTPFSAFGNITRLELRNHVARSFPVFARLLSTFRRLRQLSCIETYWEEHPSQHLVKSIYNNCLESVEFSSKVFFPAQWQILNFFVAHAQGRRISMGCKRPPVHKPDVDFIREIVQLLIDWQYPNTREFSWTSNHTHVERTFAHTQSWSYEGINDFSFSKTVTFHLHPHQQVIDNDDHGGSKLHYLTELRITVQALPNPQLHDSPTNAPGWHTFKRTMTWSILDNILSRYQPSSLTSVRVVLDPNDWDHDILVWTRYGLLKRMPFCRNTKLLCIVSSTGKALLEPSQYSLVMDTPPVGWSDTEEYEPGLAEAEQENGEVIF